MRGSVEARAHRDRRLATIAQGALPLIGTLRSYQPGWFRLDVIAGVTVGAMLVPQSMGMAELAGVPAVTGLYAAMLPLVAYALFASSRQLQVGPEATTAALVGAAVLPLAGGDPSRYLAVASLLALVVGGVLVLARVGRLGFVADFSSSWTWPPGG